MRRLWVLALAVALPFAVLAEDVVTKTDGAKLRGKVLADTPEGVKIKTAGGVIVVPREEVAVVDRAKDLADELATRTSHLEKHPSAQGWLDCARWCEERQLWVASSECLKRVLKLDPENEPARVELGYRKLGGKWVTESEYMLAQGYVQNEGRWVTQADKEKLDQGLVKADNDTWITREEAERRAKELEQEKNGIPTHAGETPAKPEDPKPRVAKRSSAPKEERPRYFEGKLLYTKSRDQIAKAFDQIAAEAIPPLARPKNAEFPPLDDASLAAALRRLKEYRYLSDLPIDVDLNPDYAVECSAAVRLLDLVGHLDHNPPKPAGCPDNLYKVGRAGTSHSNLHQGQDSARSAVDGFMFDSDPSNIDRCGHRRWCLNATMKQTAFGAYKGFVAMYALDNGRQALPQDAVLYPSRGYYPCDHIRADAAWTAHLSFQFGKPGDVKVSVTPIDANMKKGPPVEIDYLHVDQQGFGHGVACVIFRPKASIAPGARYWVAISGLKEPTGADTSLEYLVELY